MTDYHCHLLPGLDDGATDLAASCQMAATLVAAGFSRICCTPHRIYGAYDTPAERVRLETRRLHDELLVAGIQVELVPGLEYYLDEYYLALLDSDPLPLPGNLVLVEIPGRCDDAELILSLLSQTLRKGLTPLIAHPERSPLLSPTLPSPSIWRHYFGALLPSQVKSDKMAGFPNRLVEKLLAMGCQFQGNFGSFVGLYGDLPRHYAQLFHQSGYYSHYGSDAHHPRHLRGYLRKGMESAGFVPLADG